jgi:hypothetical protein
MIECKHQTNFYIEPDAPVVSHQDGSVKYVTYRCVKCSKRIYKEHSWDKDWKVAG